SAAARNVISGNGVGVDIVGGGNNVLQGNIIGLNAAGDTAEGNLHNGVVLEGGTSRNTSGGTATGARNVISGNPGLQGATGEGNGVFLSLSGGGASYNLIQGNYIGTDAGGTKALGNASSGIYAESASGYNTIGGTVAAARNIISANGGAGIRLDSNSN